MKSSVAVPIMAAMLVATFVLLSETVALTIIDRPLFVNVVDNEEAYLSISVNTPLHVSQDQVVDTQLLVLTNRLSNTPMYISTILPLSVVEDEYRLSNPTYVAGPYCGTEACSIFITLEGRKPGLYTEFYEVEVFWGSPSSSTSALVHVYTIEVSIIVETAV